MSATNFTRKGRRAPSKPKHLPKPVRGSLDGRFMTDAEQRVIDSAGRDAVSEVKHIKPGSPEFAALSRIYQRDPGKGRSDSFDYFRQFAER